MPLLPKKSAIHKLFPYLWKYKKWGFLTVFFVLLKEAAALIEPVIYREVVTTIESYVNGTIDQLGAIERAGWIVGAYVVAQLVVIGSNALLFYYLNRYESHIMYDAANRFVKHILNLSFGFHSDRKTGKMSKEYARGISAIESFVDAFVFNLIPLTIQITVITIVFATINWILPLLIIILVITFCLFTLFTTTRLLKRRDTANKSDDYSSHKAMDALMNAETVKFFQQEQYEIKKYQRLRKQWRDNKLHEWDGWIFVTSGQIAIIALALVGILSVMVWRLLEGDVTLGSFVLVISYMSMTIGMLWNFQHNLRLLREALTDLDAFFSYHDIKNSILDAPDATQLSAQNGEIVFENVLFSYSPEKQVLDGVSFTIPAGTSVALVGPSGVGKSTIIKLLYRFYDPQSGTITIDGQNIHAVTQNSLRQSLAIVPQDTALFNDTIGYNIAYGMKEATQEDIEAASRKAHIHEFIERLPKGYETMVGERGIKLSGGEKQRIAIARAFLRNAPILILDEATSSLDSASEVEIQEALKELMHGRTTIIIAHRLATVMNADNIIVLRAGGIQQMGTHEELLKKGGLYNQLWKLQAGGYLE